MPRTRTTAQKRAAASGERELVIERVFDAPRPLVFKAWTERDRVVRWYGPNGFTTTLFESDPRAGGAWRGRMRSPEGKEHAQHGVVREVAEPERFVFTFKWDDDPGPEQLVTITLAERDGKTKMTLRQGPFQSTESREGHREGWSESFDRLEGYLAGVPDELRVPVLF
jgi:uncharacterized protein YndB with AHSA1/START domain